MPIKKIIADTFRLLAFRITQEEMLEFGRGHLIFGLICTWIAGMGRYWDDPGANILQHLGVGSVIYIFVLSSLLWTVIYPLRPKNWSYFHVLTFVSLVAPPAILYAIPVEKFFSLEASNSINVWFLLIVATWRVALLLFFIRRFAALPVFATVIAALLPITAIVLLLVGFNLERAVFDIMGGLRGTSHDSAYATLILILGFSIVLFPVTAISYIIIIYLRSVGRTYEMESIVNVQEEPDN